MTGTVIPITRNRAVYTPAETAYLLSLSRSTVYVWLRSGYLPGIKAHGRWGIPKTRLHQWVDDLPEATPEEIAAALNSHEEKPTHD